MATTTRARLWYEPDFKGGSARQEARKCYARVKRVTGYKVELTDCTEGFKERYEVSISLDRGGANTTFLSRIRETGQTGRGRGLWNLEKGLKDLLIP